MSIDITDLSREILEEIALNLQASSNYQLARTCRTWAEVASARPLYQHVHLRLAGPTARACQQLYNRLEQAPHLGQYVRSYRIDGPPLPLPDGSSIPIITANTTIAFLLLSRMPHITSIELPFFHRRAADVQFINDRLVRTATIPSLRHISIDGSNGRITFDMLRPLIGMETLEGLHLACFEFDDIAGRHLGLSQSITDLTLESVNFGDPADTGRVKWGFGTILSVFPHLLRLTLDSMDHVPARCVIDNIVEGYPRLQRVAFYDMFIGNAHTIPNANGSWLARLPELQELVASGNCFTDTSLLQLSSTATLVDLTDCDLTPTAQAYAVCRWARDPAIRQRREVRLKRANGDLTMAIWNDCRNSLIDVSFCA